MIDVNKLLTAVLSGSPSTGQSGAEGAQALDRGGCAGVGDFLVNNAGALGTGVFAGGLAGTLLTSKYSRKFAGGALQVGAAALLAGLAYKAYSDYRAGKPLIPQSIGDMLAGVIPQQGGARQEPARGLLMSPDKVTADGTASLLFRAMIASAMADGRLDETERAHLIDRLEASNLSGEERLYLEFLIARPDTPEELAAAANAPEAAAQIYLVASIMIDADTPAEAAWLNDLANKLQLDPGLRRNIEAAARGAALSGG